MSNPTVVLRLDWSFDHMNIFHVNLARSEEYSKYAISYCQRLLSFGLNIEFPFNSLNSEVQIGMRISFYTNSSYNFNSNLYFLDISKQKLSYFLPSVISRKGLALKMCNKCQNEISQGLPLTISCLLVCVYTHDDFLGTKSS